MKILGKEAAQHKFIVFSQFTSMLDLVEPFLRQKGYKYTRYDGGMNNDLREASLDRLRNDENCRVLLCSLKCGSLGLNLTAATRVVILEPFWNPVSIFPLFLILYFMIIVTNTYLYSSLKNKPSIVYIVSRRKLMLSFTRLLSKIQLKSEFYFFKRRNENLQIKLLKVVKVVLVNWE